MIVQDENGKSYNTEPLNNLLRACNKVNSDLKSNNTKAMRDIRAVINRLEEVKKRITNATDNLNSNIGAKECVKSIDGVIAELQSAVNNLKV